MAGHWYTSAGEPMHQLPNKSRPGSFRDTTLKDAKKLGLWPSVTTVVKIMDKGDFLANWQIKQALYAALVHPGGLPQCTILEDGSVDEKDPAFVKWADECMWDARKQVEVKAERGSILHDQMMKAHHAYDSIPPQYLAHVDAMLDLLEQNFGKRKWIAEGTFANAVYGFGGSIDLRTLPGDPDPIILDYKFKDFGPSKKAEWFVYDEHRMQLSGYRIGLGYPEETRLFNAFGSISEPGLALLHSHTPADAASGAKLFLAALHLWQAKHGHHP